MRSLIISGWVYIEKHIFIFMYKWCGVGECLSAFLHIDRMCAGLCVLYVWVVVAMEACGETIA